ncbi:hypothetical protein [Halorientalis litorea]|jgi:hypothetical protein|uniref:hypothetical protein n=1 Tax=Halorientalis litorea TaxID=2931977 RepID=UPI001FF6138F|nr:hypothetical protein [Halorientalis litorea]
MDGVLNEVTNTVHKHEQGASELQTVCGATFHCSHDELSRLTAIETRTTSKCGRCFEGGGSY